MGDMKERARAWYERAFYSDDTRSQCIDSLTTLLAEVRTERLACGHLAGELQGEDGGTRWCAGCEREAGIRAGVIEEAAQVAERVARANSKLSRDMEDHDLLAAFYRHRAIAIAVREVEAQIRALAPADYVAVRREDFEVIAEAAAEALAHYYAPLEELGKYKVQADSIRAALSRAGKEE